ncbi:MAG: hypothetical protein ACOYYS_05725 [Chloroflexota bacterium]
MANHPHIIRRLLHGLGCYATENTAYRRSDFHKLADTLSQEDLAAITRLGIALSRGTEAPANTTTGPVEDPGYSK